MGLPMVVVTMKHEELLYSANITKGSCGWQGLIARLGRCGFRIHGPEIRCCGLISQANSCLVGWNIFYFPFRIWDVILPIDELHHFSRWLLHHQPDYS